MPIFHQQDPHAERYYDANPYTYCHGNPERYIDPNGKDSYLIIWPTYNGHYGHAAFGVDNYVYDNKLKKKIPNGKITTFGLFPNCSYNGNNAIKDKMVVGLFITDITTLENVCYGNFKSGEDYAQEGIIRIKSTYSKDEKAKQKMYEEMQNDKFYRGQSRNCATYAMEGVRESSDQDVSGEETSLLFIDYVTPNQLFKDTKELNGIEIILDPGVQVDETFLNLEK